MLRRHLGPRRCLMPSTVSLHLARSSLCCGSMSSARRAWTAGTSASAGASAAKLGQSVLLAELRHIARWSGSRAGWRDRRVAAVQPGDVDGDDLPVHGRGVALLRMRDADKAPRGGADKHQRIEDRQMADEVVAELGVGRVRIVLIDEGDPGWPPQRLVHIALARIGGDVARGATRLADRNETLRRPNAAEAELARQDQRSLQAQEGAQRVVAVEAQVDEPAIGAAAEVAVDGRKAPVEERRPGVNLLDRP